MSDPTQPPPVAKVYAAINAIQKALSKTGVAKTGKNVQQGYAFRGIDAVYAALAPLLSEHGLCVLPRVVSLRRDERTTDRGTVLFSVTLTVEFDFVAMSDGSRHVVITVGEAMDSGDKATNKAMSAAYKYACFLAFSIPTEGEDNDADRVTQPEVKPRAPRETTTSPEGSQPDAPADGAVLPPPTPTAPLPARAPYKGNWREHVIHFGKQASHQLGQIDPQSLDWWQTKWLPKPYKGKWVEKDLALRDALDASIGEPAATKSKTSRTGRAPAGDQTSLGV